MNEDFDEGENLDYVEDQVKTTFKNSNKDSFNRLGQNSSYKNNPFIKPENFLGSSGYES